jgi:HD-like signal output (HDOD) protein
METKTFLSKLDRIQEIPTLPVVALKVNKLLQDYDTSIKVLSKTIEKDQAMVTKILRLVNSAFYGFRSRIGNIPHAVTILGFNTVRNAVVSISAVEAFSGKGASRYFDIVDFW